MTVKDLWLTSAMELTWCIEGVFAKEPPEDLLREDVLKWWIEDSIIYVATVAHHLR